MKALALRVFIGFPASTERTVTAGTVSAYPVIVTKPVEEVYMNG
ncbi:MAG: hypothetical protein WCI30_06595 [Clostridia bacterium]